MLKKLIDTWFPHLLEATYTDEILTLKYSDNSIVQYKGSCTVWHKLPFMTRPGTLKEGDLSEIWEYIKTYGNPYPTAHQKPKT